MADTKSVLVLGSITGVPVMPTSGPRPVRPPEGSAVPNCTGVTPVERKLTFHSGAWEVSASRAYTLSCSVATKITLCVPLPGMLRLGTYRGWAKTRPSTLYLNSMPKLVLTLEGVSLVSLGLRPARLLSYFQVSTETGELPPTLLRAKVAVTL